MKIISVIYKYMELTAAIVFPWLAGFGRVASMDWFSLTLLCLHIPCLLM